MPAQSIVIDFDGTICEHRFPEVGEPKLGVREALDEFKKMGFHIVIHSVRTASYWRQLSGGDPRLDPVAQIDVIQDFMAEHELPYDEICLADKPLAVAYIDDRAYRFEDNWFELTQLLQEELQAGPAGPEE